MSGAADTAVSDRLKEVKAFDDSKVGVKGLSDSGITSIPSFFIHPPETLAALKPAPASGGAAIPVVDFAGFDSGDASRRRAIVDRVREAARTWGFFQVINHGVEARVLDETVAAVKAFHDQPPEAKAKHAGEEMRGVRYAVNNDLYRAKAASWHDYLQVFMSPEASPVEDIPEICRKEAITWDARAREVGETVLELLSEGLGLEPGKFKDLTFSGSRVFVGTCYPYCPQPDLTVGIKPHTDPGTVTVLLTNRVPGLQVKHGDEWVDVRPLPGALIINIGDFIQIVSNGEYKSVEHRVLANASREAKISVVMFFNVAKWKGGSAGYYGPLPELLTPANPPIYRDFTEVEFNDNFYGKGLDSKSLIEKIKL